MRIIAESRKEPDTPLIHPYTIPITVIIAALNRPIMIDALPPYQMSENISRPIESVPKKNSLFGASFKCSR